MSAVPSPYPNVEVVQAMLARARAWQKEQEQKQREAKRVVKVRKNRKAQSK
jgi:hypothetical protein